jgi:hypothetical protein
MTKKAEINWKPFRELAGLRQRDVISREHFIQNWALAQRDQGIRSGGGKR